MKLQSMDTLHRFQVKAAKHEHEMKDLMIIRLPNLKGLTLVAKTIFFAVMVAALPLGSAIRVIPDINTALPLLFKDMSNEGHLKASDKVLVITQNNDVNTCNSQVFGNNNEIEFVSNTDLKRQSSLPNEHFDFVFTHDMLRDRKLIDRTLKVNGIATYAYTVKSNFRKIKSLSNYKVVYLRQFGFTTIATLQKAKKSDSNTNVNSPTKRKLLGVTPTEEKREVLEKLEDVLLEPPRATRSRRFLKRTKYLPDLLSDSLDSYPRRIFIDVGTPEKAGSGGVLGWFAKYYPKKNKNFEIYSIDTVAKGRSSDNVVQVGMSEWLRSNVKEEEYVVMKAEAEVAEEMVKNRALDLVDELFLECKYDGVKGTNERSSRAYWECLSLYGRLKDEGVAVHQWWG